MISSPTASQRSAPGRCRRRGSRNGIFFVRYGYTPVMAAVAVIFVLLAVLIFGLIARYGDLPKLLGAWSVRER